MRTVSEPNHRALRTKAAQAGIRERVTSDPKAGKIGPGNERERMKDCRQLIFSFIKFYKHIVGVYYALGPGRGTEVRRMNKMWCQSLLSSLALLRR